MSIEEIKNEVLKYCPIYGMNWYKLESHEKDDFWPEVCRRYATECCKEKDKEIKELKAWKESEIMIWSPILDFMHKHGDEMGLKLGESISEFILEGLKKECGL